jgi:hypothetical protein
MKKLAVRLITLRYLAVLFALPLVTVSTAAASGVTFANESQTTNGQNWTISNSATATTVTATGVVTFTFLDPTILIAGIPQTANFTLTATSDQSGTCGLCGSGTTFNQFGYFGTFSFIDTTAGAYDGDNLLSGTFAVTGVPSLTGAQFTANIGSGNGTFVASDTAGNLNQLVLTSAFINLSTATDQVSSWSLSSVTPNFAVGSSAGGQAYPSGTFTGADSGQFSATFPTTFVSAPEPGTLPLTLIGGILCALAFIPRHRRSKVAPATRSIL